MGYGIRFSLESVKGDSATAFWSDFEAGRVTTIDGTPLRSIFYNHHDTAEINWSGWKEDFENISFEYPNTLFTIRGIGEKSGDLWVAYARNGKIETVGARITFDDPSNEIMTNSPTLEQVEAFEKRKQKIQLLRQRAEIDRQLEEL